MVSDQDGDYLKPGTLIDGKFEVRRLLGQGGMGAVVEATHLLRQARVALKFMSPEVLQIPGVVERFLNEGVAASRINNDHVVKVLDVSKLPNGQPYMVMEYLDGEDLESLLYREGPEGMADVPRAIHFVLQVLRGLQVAHQVGIIHRDLKPANCFVVSHDGEPDFIKLVDFGISKVQQPEGEMKLTHQGSTMGTPLYVSLEQAKDASDVDARSDLYSVAVMLYELLCGHTPFVPTNMAELYIHLAITQPRSLDELRALPPGLAAVVHKGLEKDRADRYQSAGEFAAALAPYADERSELVLRQILHRGSGRPSWTPSKVPSTLPLKTKTGTIAVASARVPAPTLATTTEPGTPPPPPPVEEPRTPHAATPRKTQSTFLAVGALLVTAAAGGIWFVARGESASNAENAGAPGLPAANGATVIPGVVSEALPELAEPASSNAPSVNASAALSGTAAPNADTPAPAAASAALTSERLDAPARAAEPKPTVSPKRRPELKQISIED